MTNINGMGMLFLLINFSTGVLMMLYIAFRSVTNKQFSVMAGLLAFIFGIYFMFSVAGQSQEGFPFVFVEFGVPAVVVHIFYKNIRKSSTIAFVGTVFAVGFVLTTHAGRTGFYGPFGFEIYFLPRLLVLLASMGISFVLLYIYNKNVTYSIIGSLIGLTIILAILLIILFAFFEFGFNLFLSPLVSILLKYVIPIFTGVAVIRLSNYV